MNVIGKTGGLALAAVAALSLNGCGNMPEKGGVSLTASNAEKVYRGNNRAGILDMAKENGWEENFPGFQASLDQACTDFGTFDRKRGNTPESRVSVSRDNITKFFKNCENHGVPVPDERIPTAYTLNGSQLSSSASEEPNLKRPSSVADAKNRLIANNY